MGCACSGCSGPPGENVVPAPVCARIMKLAKTQDWSSALKELTRPPIHNEIELIIQVTNQGHTLLHEAAVQGNKLACHKLIKLGVDIDILDGSKHTPLGFACADNHLELVEELISLGADVNVLDIFDHGPLYAAASRGHLEVVRRLVKAGVDLQQKDSEKKWISSEWADHFGHKEMGHYLRRKQNIKKRLTKTKLNENEKNSKTILNNDNNTRVSIIDFLQESSAKVDAHFEQNNHSLTTTSDYYQIGRDSISENFENQNSLELLSIQNKTNSLEMNNNYIAGEKREPSWEVEETSNIKKRIPVTSATTMMVIKGMQETNLNTSEINTVTPNSKIQEEENNEKLTENFTVYMAGEEMQVVE